ncbi:ATP-binding cassette domain-containing protein [Mycobacterium yunnanensis]|uniref:ABC-type quaternary amine transporter n=1 Tax=Mycobacterium yunnanensis TaxID=368477 RepID=A0A9X3BTM6_9MYCO|nr:ATP-binding cassette domain-containing protein [Mycobacterium yunnanensis]MCV7421819.1 ATP-binding cassette domain-containing protein [Mycobacterium yunnanensis]
MITFENVVKTYPDGTRAVDDVSLECTGGRITVFVGPSGCGKTTSLRMINRSIEPSSGRVLLNGKDVREESLTDLRRGIGYVIQSAGLFPHRTVIDNITTVPRLLGTPRKQARSRAGDLMELVGLAPVLANRYPYQLSGGQQQRVGVARALAADPPVLLMDEPFAAVDPVVRHDLQQEFLRVQRELAKTIVFVTHDIDEAVLLGDKIAIFQQGGTLAQFDTPQALLTTPANDFVASFLGAGRGLRSLQFVGVGDLKLDTFDVVAESELADTDGWTLVVDDQRRPRGWVNRGTGPNHPADPIELETTNLRQALDRALLSPAKRVPVCDADGRVLGTLGIGEIVTAMDAG